MNIVKEDQDEFVIRVTEHELERLRLAVAAYDDRWDNKFAREANDQMQTLLTAEIIRRRG